MHPQPNGQQREPVTAVQLVPLPEGLYAFSASPPTEPVPDGGGWLPVLEISVPPGAPDGQFRLLDAEDPSSAWLTRSGETIVGKVTGSGCRILVTSLSLSESMRLGLSVRRLSQGPATNAVIAPEPTAPPTPPIVADGRRTVPLRILGHVQRRGDLKATDCAWVGDPGSRLQLEAFAVQPLQDIASEDIEYKAVSANGAETPWVRGGGWCGTRGQGVGILGFAFRLNPTGAAFYDIEYGAATRSGGIMAPVKNGLPCRSRQSNDPIEALWVRLVERRSSETIADQL